MKKVYTILVLVIAVVVCESAIKHHGRFSSVPPEGHTGASGDYCVNCHSTFGLNSGGGSVAVTGLPTGTYNAGQAYNFSLTISHSAANRKKWGFSIKAVNNNGLQVGTFSSTNANAAINGEELSHNNAVTTGDQASYTYNNLKWTAPTSPSASDKNVTFYYVGNAADGNFSSSNDYIYSASSAIILPIKLNQFKASTDNSTVTLNWQTATEQSSSYFEIEKSDDGQTFYPIGKVNASGTSSMPRSYTFIDSKPSYFERLIFYRLKLIDKDGSYTLSDVAVVRLNATKVFVSKVYPTVVTEGKAINAEIVSDKKQDMIIQLIDISGKELQLFKVPVIVGSNKVIFNPTANLSKGWLFAKFSGNGFQQTVSLMVN